MKAHDSFLSGGEPPIQHHLNVVKTFTNDVADVAKEWTDENVRSAFNAAYANEPQMATGSSNHWLKAVMIDEDAVIAECDGKNYKIPFKIKAGGEIEFDMGEKKEVYQSWTTKQEHKGFHKPEKLEAELVDSDKESLFRPTSKKAIGVSIMFEDDLDGDGQPDVQIQPIEPGQQGMPGAQPPTGQAAPAPTGAALQPNQVALPDEEEEDDFFDDEEDDFADEDDLISDEDDEEVDDEFEDEDDLIGDEFDEEDENDDFGYATDDEEEDEDELEGLMSPRKPERKEWSDAAREAAAEARRRNSQGGGSDSSTGAPVQPGAINRISSQSGVDPKNVKAILSNVTQMADEQEIDVNEVMDEWAANPKGTSKKLGASMGMSPKDVHRTLSTLQSMAEEQEVDVNDVLFEPDMEEKAWSDEARAAAADARRAGMGAPAQREAADRAGAKPQRDPALAAGGRKGPDAAARLTDIKPEKPRQPKDDSYYRPAGQKPPKERWSGERAGQAAPRGGYRPS